MVRVPLPGGPARIELDGPGGSLDLAALNPGPLEYLRASVDYDGIPPDDLWRFNLTVQRIRSPASPLVEEQEVYRAVSVDPDDPGYVGERLAASTLVRLAGEPPRARPHVTGGAAPGLPGYVGSAGDGRRPGPLTDYDLIGSEPDGTGLFALDQVAHLDFLCLLSAAPGADLGPVALFAAERYCRRRNALLLLDPPNHWKSAADVLRSQRERGFASPNVVTYFPTLEEPRADGRPPRPVSALGAIAGLLARQDPADDLGDELRLRGARPTLALDDTEAAALARAGVNALLPLAGGVARLAGLVTLARAGDGPRAWRRLVLRRRALAILTSLARGTRWAVLQPAGPETWAAVVAQVTRYLADLQGAGLLAGREPREGFYVRCDRDTCGASGLTFVVGVALAAPGEFIAFRLAHDLSDCTITEPGWLPHYALAG